MKRGRVITIFVIVDIILLLSALIMFKDSIIADKNENYDYSITVDVLTGPSQFETSEKVRTNDTIRIMLDGVPEDLDVIWEINAPDINLQVKFGGNPVEKQFDSSCIYFIKGKPTPDGDESAEWASFELPIYNHDTKVTHMDDKGFKQIRPHFVPWGVSSNIIVKGGLTRPSINSSLIIENALGTFDIDYYLNFEDSENKHLESKRVTGTGNELTIDASFYGLNPDDEITKNDYSFVIRLSPVRCSCSGYIMNFEVTY